MIIVLEGPDGAGKTHLAKQLETALSAKYVPSPHLRSQNEFDDVTEDQEHMAKSPNIYILDRVTWISELVYSRNLNRPCRLDFKKLPEYLALPQIVVYCAPTGISKKDISQEEKAHKSADHLEAVMKKHVQIIDTYENFFGAQKTAFDYFHQYNWRKPGAYEKLIGYLEEKVQCVV